MEVLEIKADLKAGQISKFRHLLKGMKLINGKAYFPTDQMHGVLLTNSRQGALNIVKSHLAKVQPYIINIENDQYIKHIGIDVLLEALGEENPKKKILYLSARAYISAKLADDPNVFKDALLRGQQQDRKKIQVVQLTKRNAERCALSGVVFGDGVECHIHHIEGISETPDLATDPKNLIALSGEIHKEYHSWVIQKGESVNRATLKQFAKEHQYRTDWQQHESFPRWLQLALIQP
jgi:hypothetical protein